MVNKTSQCQIKVGSVLLLLTFASGSDMAGHCYQDPRCQSRYLNPGIWGTLGELSHTLLGCHNNVLYSMSYN